MTKKLQSQSYLLLLILFLIAAPGRAQRSFLGADGGFEGTAAIVNGTTNASPVATNWTKSTTIANIASETATVRSGSKSLKVSTTSTSCRVYSPAVPISASTTAWQVQYYRRSTNLTNTVENQSGSYRTGVEQINGTYSSVTAINTWEKVTYSPSSVTSATTAAAGILVRAKGTGGDTYFDDFVLYESATVDATAPNSAGTVSVSNATGTTADVSWIAATGGVDGGGYMVVRYTTNPNADNDPNVNGVYGVGNTITNGTGSLVGTVCYVGTGTSFTDTGLSSGSYFYKVYTYDKAYNYAAESQGSVATAAPTITSFSPTTVCQGGNLVITGNNFTGATSVTVGGAAAASYVVNSSTQITAVVGQGSSGSVSVSLLGNTAILAGVTINPAPATPTITASGPTTFCAGSSVVLTSSPANSYLWSNGATTQSITVSTSGSYAVSVANANGCQSPTSDTTLVTVNPVPASPMAGYNNPVCEGSSLNLTASTIQTGGYTMNSNSGVSFIDISATGTSIGAAADEGEINITIPSFNFNGTAYTTARVGTNGAIALGSTTGDIVYNNQALPSAANTAGNIFLAPYWEDLDTVTGPGTIKTQTVGNVFIIQYTSVNLYDYSAGTLTFQVQLNLVTGAIHFIYQDVMAGSATYDKGITATVGIQMSSTSALQYSYNTASLTNGQSISFTPLIVNYSWTGPNGFTSTAQNPTIPAATAAANGVYSVVTVNATSGCQSTPATTTVALNPGVSTTPTITAGGPTTFCSGSSVVLTASPASSYLWSNGATTQAITVSASGNYTVQTFSAAGCPSPVSTAKTVTVNPAPATPTITPAGASTICSGTSLTLTSSAGANYLWSTGETTQSINVSATDSYTVQIIDAIGCTSAYASAANITVLTTPAMPTANAQSFCNSAKVSNLTATGTALKWYNVATGGAALATTASVTTGTYYVTQTVNGCESARKSVAVTIYVTPPPTAAANQTFCNSGTIADFVVTGTALKWYLYSSESPEVSTTFPLISGNADYVTQTLNGCESTKIAVTPTINVTPAPTGLPYQIYAGSGTLADLTMTGTAVKWYASATGGTALPTTTALGDGTTYYASQTVNNCEGIPRFAVTTKRISDASQNFCGSATVANLAAAPLVNQVANWFSSAISTVILPGANALTTKNYYVEQAFPPLTSTLAGSANGGTANGTGAAAQFNYPRGITTDSSGNIYLSDTDNHRIRKITPAGVTTHFAGSTQGYADGDSLYSKFNSPSGIVVDAAGYVYVCDTNNHCIRKISPYGNVTTFAGSTTGLFGTTNATGTSARFYYPVGLVMDSAGNFYVADSSNQRIRKITPAGVVTTLAGTTQGYADATGTAAKFNYPFSLAIDSADNLYVTEGYNYCVRKITLAGVVTTLAGSNVQGMANGTGTAAQFYNLSGVTVDATGTLFVTDTNFSTDAYIRKITPAGVVTNYTGGAPGYADGTLGVAKFQSPHAITADTFGNLYVTEYTRIRAIRKETFSNRVPVSVTINNPDGSAPTTTPRTFCNTGYVSDLTATGIGTFQWYDVATGGTALAPTTPLVTGTYYVSQTLNGCESARTAATITVNVTPTPTGLGNQIYAGSGTLANLTVNGANIKWYATATGGAELPNTTALVDTTTYYASQTLNACESATRLAVKVKRISAASQSFCGDITAANIITTPSDGQTAFWYASASGGMALTNEPLSTGTYYVEEGPIVSNRVAVNVTINPLPATPTITAGGPVTFCSGGSVVLTSSLGTTYTWSSGVINSRNNTVYSSGSYTVRISDSNGCVSLPSNPVIVTVNQTPSTPQISSNTPVCQGSTLNLTANNVSLNRYQMNGNSGVQFINISNTGTSIGTMTDDSLANITIPPFTFNGVVYTSARVSTNGVIVFGNNTAVVSPNNTGLSGDVTAAAATFLAPYWDDLNVSNVSEPASIKTQTVGDNFIIQYTMHNHYQYYGGTITFQVQMSLSSGIIHFVYQDVVFGDAAFDAGISATIGIKMNSNNQVQYSYNSASLVNGQSITFTPIAPTYLWTAPNTTTNSQQNPSIQNAIPSNSGTYTLVVTDPVSGCKSATASTTVLVKTTTPPTVATTQEFCPYVTVADLVTSGQGPISWFDVATGGTPLTSVTPLSTGTYYVSQLLNDCESARVAVQVTINPITTSSINVSACGSYTWSVNNQTYTQSGTYTVTGANQYGCLDTKTLVLTIGQNNTVVSDVTACNSYTWPINNQTYTTSGTYSYVVDCHTEVLNLNLNCALTVNLKLNIEGYYDVTTHAMRPVLANQGIGTSTTNVDVVTVELRNSAGELVKTTTAMLHTNGTLTATFNSAPGSYYIAVNYRNAIETWSANPIAISQAGVTYNFSDSASKAYGGNMKMLEPGVYGFYSGDLNQDGFIEIQDFAPLTNDNDVGAEGYYNTDLNGDGFVEIQDYPLLFNNSDAGIEAMHP